MQIVNNKKFLALLVVAGLLVLGVLFYRIGTYFFEEHLFKQQVEKLTQISQKSRAMFEHSVSQSRHKLQFLYSTPPVAGLSRTQLHNDIDPLDGSTTAQWKLRLQTLFSAFLQSNPEIRQIRLIGQADNGKELVRVESQGGRVVVIPDGLLQEKGATDYYQAISQLKPNEDYISDITLNREYGVIDNPIWPTFRVSKPVFDENFVFFGFVIINIDASALIDSLQQEYQLSNFALYMLNTDGYFISAPKNSLTFGFDLERPNATWQKLTNDARLPIFDEVKNLRFEQEDNFMLASKVILSARENRVLYFVSALPAESLAEMWEKQRYYFILLLIILAGVVIVIVYGYQRYVNKLLNLYDDQSRYEAIIAGSSDAIIGIDSDGSILEWNESAAFLFGQNEAQAKRHKIDELIISANQAHALTQEVITSVIKNNAPLSLEIETTNLATKNKFLSISLSPVMQKNRGGNVTVSALVRDITEIRNNQQKIISLNASLETQVQERTQQLEVATAEAMAANQTKSAFVANISHEIRTPLNGIGGMLELLTREPLTDKQKGYLDMAKSSVGTLTVLINDLLDLTKIESGKLDIELASFNLIENISSVIATMALRANEKGLELLFDCAEVKHENIISDGYRIKQILVNLLGNAIKFTEQGQVIVKLATRNSTNQNTALIDISVQDTGIGISQEQQNKLFKPFSQANSSIAKEFGGTGLGLSICRQLANILGGEITMSSVLGQGSMFTLSIKAQVDRNADYKLVGPILSGRRCLLIMSSEQESDILTRQLQAWGALALTSREIEDLYTIEAESLPDLLVLDATLTNSQFGTWLEKTKVTKKCKLLLLLHSYDDKPLIDESEHCVHLIRPLVPLQLLLSYQNLRHPERKRLSNQQTANMAPIAMQEGNNYTVLIVDDNEINRYVAQGILERFAIQFYMATNGAEAIKCLQALNQQGQVDLILMDCQMPVLNGYEATQAIRRGEAGERMQNVPIIAMTAGAMAGDKDACLQAGMNDFIAKPLDASLFEQKVLAYLPET